MLDSDRAHSDAVTSQNSSQHQRLFFMLDCGYGNFWRELLLDFHWMVDGCEMWMDAKQELEQTWMSIDSLSARTE